MSRADSTNTPRRPAVTSRSNLHTPHDTELEIARINAQLKRLIDGVLPKAPYLISVPSDVPYRHNSRFINNWHLGTPFTKDEEPLQYMSFLTHQDTEQSLIKAVGAWSDEKGNLVDEDPSPQQIYGSASKSPSLGSQRKKISLNDYKTKAKGGEESTRQDRMGKSGQLQPRGNDLESHGLPQGEAENREVKAGSPIKRLQDKKRSFDDVADVDSKLKSPKPEKRARSKSPPRAKSPRSPTKNPDKMNPTKARVPSLLSPTLPPSGNVTSIPELLSPTLPSSIEDLLAHGDDEQEPKSTAKHQRGDSARSALGSGGSGSSPLPASKKTNITRTNHERHLSPSLQVGLKEAKGSPGARGRDSTSSPGPRRRHVIVLKYGKRNKKRVEALLKFAPRSKKQIPRSEHANSDDKYGSARDTNGLVLEKNSQREKDGPTSHPSEPPSKRTKPAPSLNLSDRPTTPIPPAFKSPSIQNSIQPRSAFSTPKKDLKTTAMRRVESSEGLDARTPIASVTRQSTPGNTEKPAISTRLSSPSEINPIPSQRDDLRRAWRGVNVKHYELGRTLKHEGQSLLQQETPEEQQGVLLTIEALLCFMLNQTALSYANNGSDPGWRTIVPYLSFVLRMSKAFLHLHGLVSQLGAVCRQMISRYDLERLAKEPLPDDHTGSAPTPGSDGNTKSSEDVEKARRRWNAFRTELTDNARELQRAWLDGYQELSPEILKQAFPDTWARRARDSTLKAAPGTEKLTPDNLAGGYHLPLDVNTSAVEAVRYAKGVLVEWAEREGVKWETRIEI
jgi:hypothetical protein